MRSIESLEDFTDTLRSLGVSWDTLHTDEHGTLRDTRPDWPTRSGTGPELPLVVSGAPGDDLVLGGPLGRGGMGEILLAQQSSLERTVAVKRPLDADPDGADPARELIAEALVGGALEHPNIVPVHLLGKDQQGRPLLVMKRIEGRTWAELLREGRDLSRDVDILMNVCRALHFAHAHGVIHRDVKPSNVMVGRFGEVYLLDWGIAVGSDDSTIPGLRRASASSDVVGTPQYMAPEMAMPPLRLDARTDVYLVGAVLHELLTGRPPRRGASTIAMVFAAWRSPEPTLPDDLPEDLAAICARAMRRDPAERFAGTDEIRRALAQFESRRTARALMDEATSHLEQLRALPVDADAALAQRTFSASRFGFEQALRIWPESSRGQRGREQCLVVMARREIEGGRVDSARLLVAELGEIAQVPHDVRTALAALEERRAAEAKDAAALKSLAREHDPSLSARERGLVSLVAGQAYALSTVALAIAYTYGVVTRPLAVNAVASVLIFVAIAVWRRVDARIEQNEIGRSAVRSMMAASGTLGAWMAIAWARDVEVIAGLAGGQLLLVLSLSVTAAFHPGLARPVVSSILGLPLILAAGELGAAWALVASGVAGAVPLALMPAWLARSAQPKAEG